LRTLFIPQMSARDLRSSDRDEPYTSHPAIFTIPNHITTPACHDEDLGSQSGGIHPDVGLEGRPRATSTYTSNRSIPSSSKDVQSSREGLTVLDDLPASPRGTNYLAGQGQSRNATTRKASYHVNETPFPSLMADVSNAPPEYEVPHHHLGGEQMPSLDTGITQSNPIPAAMGRVESGGRFPRWRGWLEKRALEKHFDRLDAASGLTVGPDVKRKKSWGTGIYDEDALSEVEDQEEVSVCVLRTTAKKSILIPFPPQSKSATRETIKERLHLYTLGSRFISHIASLPLCSVYLDIPPPPLSSRGGQRLLRRSIPEGAKRQVLLVGSAHGLYVVECRKRRKQDSIKTQESCKRESREADGKRRDEKGAEWNDNIRCRQVSSVLSLYFGVLSRPKLT
jgi:hypothetical protein